MVVRVDMYHIFTIALQLNEQYAIRIMGERAWPTGLLLLIDHACHLCGLASRREELLVVLNVIDEGSASL